MSQSVRATFNNSQTASGNTGIGDGPIHAGDQVSVNVYDAPDMSVATVVSASGDILLPVYGVFHIDGLTSLEAASTIQRLFVEKGVMLHPLVQVTVQQFGSGVTVMGEVTNPGFYTLAGRNRLADVLAQAGGLRASAGQLIEITPRDPSQPKKGVHWDPTLKDSKNVSYIINPGDLVFVSHCGVVFFHGNVGRPGGYPICDASTVTLSQGLALAGGVKPSTNYNRSLLIRTENGKRTVQEIRVNDIIHGKVADIALEAEDIVYVEPSWQKFTIKTAISNAVSFGESAWIYFYR
jgi:polysaccharide export outer membrane protein